MPEKFEDIANECIFAIFVVTMDDCFVYDHILNKEQNVPLENLERTYRARQNVILEFNIFGAIGRKKIAILLENKKGFDLPSDMQGLGWIQITEDSALTKAELYKELKFAGICN